MPDIEDLFKDLFHPNPYISKSAIYNIIHYYGEQSIPRLFSDLGNENEFIRRRVVKALGTFGPVVISHLSKCYKSTQDRLLKTSCLKAFIIVAANNKDFLLTKEDIEMLDMAYLEESPDLLITSISLFRQLESKGINYLIKAVNDKNILRASFAITAISELESPVVEKLLIDLLKEKSRDEIVLNSAQNALVAINNRKKYNAFNKNKTSGKNLIN